MPLFPQKIQLLINTQKKHLNSDKFYHITFYKKIKDARNLILMNFSQLTEFFMGANNS